MRKFLVALLALFISFSGLVAISTATASAASYDRCPDSSTDQWYVHTYFGAGQTMHCHATGNHITIDHYVGAALQGLVFESWNPTNVKWFQQIAPDGYSRLHFCSQTIPGDMSVKPGPPGWEHQFDPGGGAINHWHNVSPKPYRTDGGTAAQSSQCVNYTGINGQSWDFRGI